jgi:Holliday junction resolvase RusA-like endonuclease
MYTDKATREYEQAIKEAYDGPLFDGPVSMSVTFTKNKITISISEIEAESSLRGDLDNYVKSIMDGLNGVAYKDDGQVLNIRAHKR